MMGKFPKKKTDEELKAIASIDNNEEKNKAIKELDPVEKAKFKAEEQRKVLAGFAAQDKTTDETTGMVTGAMRNPNPKVIKRSDPEGINRFLPKSEFIKIRQAENEKHAELQKLENELNKKIEKSSVKESEAVKNARKQVAKFDQIANKKKAAVASATARQKNKK